MQKILMQTRTHPRNKTIQSRLNLVLQQHPMPPATTDPLASPALTIADVVASTIQSFPQIEQARLQAGVAAGEATSARGFYDHKLQAYSLGEPTGYYENYRSGIGVARQLWWGGYVSASYRNGRGDFAPWYKERETNKGGELKLALVQPLLQGRAIDPARVEVLQANLKSTSCCT